MKRFLPLSVLALCSVTAMQVHMNGNSHFVSSPLFNRQTGLPGRDQVNDLNLVNLPVKYLSLVDCDDLPPSTSFSGFAVWIDNDRKFGVSMLEEQRALECVQNFGAVAAVRLVGDIGAAGFNGQMSEFRMRTTGNIPYITCLREYVKAEVVALKQGDTVTIDIVADSNPWKYDLWDTWEYFIYFRVLLPLANFGILFQSIYACLLHFLNYRRSSAPMPTAVPFMVACLVVDIIGCAFRGGYGAAGPLFIGNVWYSIEVFGLAMPTPIHTLSTLMAAIVFIRLDVFGLLKRKKPLEGILTIIGTLNIGAQLFACSCMAYIATFRTSVVVVVAINAGFSCIIELFCSFAFIRYGFRFIKLLDSGPSIRAIDISDRRNAQMKKLIRWVMISTAAHLFVVFSYSIAAFNARLFYTPEGLATSVGVLWSGQTAVAFAQAMAFTPMSTKEKAKSQRYPRSNEGFQNRENVLSANYGYSATKAIWAPQDQGHPRTTELVATELGKSSRHSSMNTRGESDTADSVTMAIETPLSQERQKTDIESQNDKVL